MEARVEARIDYKHAVDAMGLVLANLGRDIVDIANESRLRKLR